MLIFNPKRALSTISVGSEKKFKIVFLDMCVIPELKLTTPSLPPCSYFRPFLKHSIHFVSNYRNINILTLLVAFITFFKATLEDIFNQPFFWVNHFWLIIRRPFIRLKTYIFQFHKPIFSDFIKKHHTDILIHLT